MSLLKKFHRHLWSDKTRRAFREWLRLIFSINGIWCFLPAILGGFFVYWAEFNAQYLIAKQPHEILAICLMGIAVILFLARSLLYRLEIDYILLTMAVNFLCREIHFVGTDNGVVIVAAIVLVWIIYRKDRIWADIENARAVQIALAGTIFTYSLSIIISRRVFSVEYLGGLPIEADVHVALEEVLENIAHLYLICVGIFAFFSIPSKKPPKTNSILPDKDSL
jgi:hypothetical protein